MIEIEAKTRLKPTEGVNFFFTLFFLTATGIIQRQYSEEQCILNLELLVQLVFFSQIIKGTCQILTIVPRYKNRDIAIFLQILDLTYYISLFALFIFAIVLYFSDCFDSCSTTAPVHSYFTKIFLLITLILFIILISLGIVYLVLRGSRRNKTNYSHYEDS